jgi:hypothetical protein
VGAGEARGASEGIDVERLGVTAVGEVSGAQKVAGGGHDGHAQIIAPRAAPGQRPGGPGMFGRCV